MAPVMFHLSDVTPKLPKNAAFLLRMSRKCFVLLQNPEQEIRVVELVLMYQQGIKIQATIAPQYILDFVDQLQEGGLYTVMNFTVKENIGQWKPTSHPYRLYFNDSTKIKPQSDDRHPTFPFTLYRFTPFIDVFNSPDINAPDLIDIIGAYNPREKLKKLAVANGPSTCSSFYLRDLENKRMHCIMWNEYADQFDSFLETPRKEPVVVLLQLCCINKGWGNSKGVVIS